MSVLRVVQITVLAAVASAAVASAAVPGLLRVDSTNKRWLTNDAGKAIVLTGPHHWHINQNYKSGPVLGWQNYQDTLKGDGSNFYRGWTWSDTHFSPFLYAGSTPFNLNTVSTTWTGRLKARASRARRKGLYTSVMFFQGWSIQDHPVGGRGLRTDNPWAAHPFHVLNNRNAINGDFASPYQGSEIHADRSEAMSNAITNLQKKYLQYVVSNLRSLNNIIWEISNESPGGTAYRNWQNVMVNAIRAKDTSHLILVSCRGGESFGSMKNTSAELVAFCLDSKGRSANPDPPHADGSRVFIADSDHLQPTMTKSKTWAWKYFLRGYHPWFMDLTEAKPNWTRISWNPNAYTEVPPSLGAVRKVADSTNLRMLVPQAKATTAPVKYVNYAAGKIFALYSTDNPRAKSGNWADGKEYLILGEAGRTLKICNLQSSPTTVYNYEWLDLKTGGRRAAGTFAKKTGSCKNRRNTTGDWAVLHIWL